jgi:formylglycine-generating enzyme required for sulfatase activity
VTNARFAACVREGVCTAPANTTAKTRSNYYGNAAYDDYPVIYITWNQAKSYCEWREARLPTEAEWEKAARGTDERTYPWGEGINCDLANLNYSGKPDSACVGDTTPVGAYPGGVSLYGAYDMAGNVWEWVYDWYHPDYYAQSPAVNPAGPATGDGKMLRGGSWILNEHFVRTTSRANYEPYSIIHDFGFRCAMSLPD